MSFTLDDLTEAEKERLGDAEARRIVASWNTGKAKQDAREAARKPPVEQRLAALESEVEALKTR